jgi:signal recognition particle subunit SRP54
VVDSLIKEICAALLASDVNVMLVQKLRGNIKKSINMEELANNTNKKRLIEKVKSFHDDH